MSAKQTMKATMNWMMAAILVCSLSVMGFSSCTTDNDDNINKEYWDYLAWLYDISNVAYLDSGYVSYYDLLWDIINDHSGQESYDDQLYYEWALDYLDSLANLYQVAYSRADGYKDESGLTLLGLKYVTITYKTTGADGSEKKLSELIAYPVGADGKTPTEKLKNLIIGCHATITSNERRPTNFSNLSFGTDVNMLTLIGSNETSLVVIPDYEGYGVTSKDPHPYCNRDVTAQQVIDGAKAAVVWYEKNVDKLKADWKSVAVGYSQGGAVAAGVLNYYNAKKVTGLNLIGAVCGDGPYDPMATLNQYLKDNRLYMPVAAALMIKGMIDTNKQLKALGCTYKDFVTDKFYDTGIFDWVQNKSFTVNEVQTKLLEYSAKHGGGSGFTMMTLYNDQFKAYIPENIKEGDDNWDLTPSKGKNYCTADQCFKPGFIEYFKNGKVTGDIPEAKLKALEKALKENSLTYGTWKPSGAYPHAYYFFHSTRDEVVPFCNYESVRNAWGTKLIMGNPFQSKFTDLHVETGAYFYVVIASDRTHDILAQKWAPGEKQTN